MASSLMVVLTVAVLSHVSCQDVSAATIVTHPMNQTVYGDRQAMFNVSVVGNTTELTYQWQKDGLNLTEMKGKFEGVNTSTLTIKTARNIDEGWYRCVIRYRTGNGSLISNKAFLNVEEIPDIPVFSGGSWNSTSITISWMQDLASVILRYELRYNFKIRQCPYNEERPNSGQRTVNISLRHNFTLTNSTETPVEEDSTYNVDLRAVNSDGSSQFGGTQIATLGAAPTQAPRNLRGSCNKRDRAIIIQWESIECSHRNGEIVGYNVTYYPSSDMQMSESMTTESESVHLITARGLMCNTEYVYQVQGISDEHGTGPPATIKLKTLLLQGIVQSEQSYDNNSVIYLDSTERVLQYFTKKSGCCDFDFEAEAGEGEGEWLFPNQSSVRTMSHGDDIYSSRGEGVVNLNWKENAVLPSGIFCCEIRNPNRTLCIGVYPENDGIPVVETVTYDPLADDLVCTTTGGPATNVNWRKNGQPLIFQEVDYQQKKRITFTENATYETTLHIPDDSIENYNATYECSVMNSRGNDSSMTTLEALLVVLPQNLYVGQNETITCITQISVDVIEWMDSDGDIIASEDDIDQLSLDFIPVDITIHNRQYTCRANKSGSVNKTVTLSVSVQDDALMVDIHVPEYIPSLGELFTVNCSAKVILELIKSPLLTLKHPSGTNISGVVGTELSVVFDSVRATDAGEYTCVGEIVFSELNNLSIVVQSKEIITLKLPTPKVNITYSNSLIAGSTTTLNCTVDEYTIRDLNVALNITWLRSEAVLSNDHERVMISEVSGPQSTFISQLTLSPLSVTDTNITCSAGAYLDSPRPFINQSSIESEYVQLNIEDPDVFVSVTTTFGENITAGVNYTLFCHVDGIGGLMLNIEYMWWHFNGSDNRLIENNSSVLSLSPLKLSDAGEYICQVNINSTLLNSNISIFNMLPHIVRVFVPLPMVNFIPPTHEIFVRSSPNFTCVVEFDTTVDIPLIVEIRSPTPFKSNGPICMKSYLQYSRIFTINSVEASNSGKQYACIAHVTGSTPFILEQPQPRYGFYNLTVSSLTVTLSSCGDNIAGEQYNLTCTAVISGSSDTPIISWNGTDSDETISHYYDNGTYSKVLQFGPLQVFDQNIYLCEVEVADIIQQEVFNLTVKIPSVSVTITDGGAPPTAGENYSLTCNVYGVEKLNPILTFQWMKRNDTEMPIIIDTNSSTLYFSVLSISDAGNYTCVVTVDSDYLEEAINEFTQTFKVNFQAPPPTSVTVLLTHSNTTIFIGQPFNLTCLVNLPPTMDIPVNLNITWEGQNGSMLLQDTPEIMDDLSHYSSTASFVANVQNDNAQYICTAAVSPYSSFVTTSGSQSGSENYRIVGRPSQPTGLNATATSTSITVTWSIHEDDIIYSYELQYDYVVRECQRSSNVINITLGSPASSYMLDNLEEDSDFTISLVARNPAGKSEAAIVNSTTLQSAPTGSPQEFNIASFDFTNVTVEWKPVECLKRNGPIDGYRLIYHPTVGNGDVESILIHSSTNRTFTVVGLQPRISYTLVLEAVNQNYTLFSPHVQKSVDTTSPNGIGFLLHGHLHSNNSLVTITEIGEFRNALLCITNYSNCCKNLPNRIREWYYPNDGSTVGTHYTGKNFYRSRGLSVIRLNRRNSAISPTGMYRCRIPISDSTESDIYIGVYNAESGYSNITSMTLNRANATLTCISTGGPATTVTWRKNNQLLLIDAIIYKQEQKIIDSVNATYENVLISDVVANLVGVLTCVITNTRGSSSKSLSTNGVIIERGHQTHLVGSNVTITCRSDTDTVTMEWLRDDDVVVAFMPTTRQLDLSFSPVNDSIHGKVFTCRVNRSLSLAEQNFTMSVSVPSPNDTLDLTIVPMGNATAGEGISINCIVSKRVLGLRNLPNVSWSGQDANVEITGKSALFNFSQLLTSHGTLYTCQGSIDSPALNETLFVMENYSLIVKIPTPTVTVALPQPSIHYAGTNLSLTCNITLSPFVDTNVTVNVTWFNGSTLLSNDSDRIAISLLSGEKPPFTSNLFINHLYDVDNTSSFMCQATADSGSNFIGLSGIGEDSVTIPVMQRIPSAPKVVIRNITSKLINLTWSQQPDDFIKGFNIITTYNGPCHDYHNITTYSKLHPSTRNFNITGLQEYSNYTIEVSAFNDAGSNISQPFNVTTRSSAPDGPPTSIMNDSVNLTTITISWDTVNCIQQNSIITKYQIMYYDTRFGDESRTRSLNISAPETTATIQELDPNTEYVFNVQAVNEDDLKSPPINFNVNTIVPQVVGFFLRNRHYGNNSVVYSDDIGEESEALFCLTNNTECCGENDEEEEGWYLPDSSPVHLRSEESNDNNNIGIYRTRGSSVVRLHRKSNATLPSGVFRCEIADKSGTNQTIYIGVYPNKVGAGVVIVEDLDFNKEQQALTCTSTGGPATTVSWMKDGSILDIDGTMHYQTQMISNTTSSTFMTTIFIRPDLDQSKVTGNYTCVVSNSRVVSQSDDQRKNFQIHGIRVTGHESALPYGSSASLNCTTDLAVNTMEWLDKKRAVLLTGMNKSKLELKANLTDSDSLQYTCKVTNNFGSQYVTVIIEALSTSTPSTSIAVSTSVAILVSVILIIAVIVIIVIVRRKYHGKLTLFSEHVKSKPSMFVIHSTPLRVGTEDTNEQKSCEALEMSTFGKIDSETYEGDVVPVEEFDCYVKKMHNDRDEDFEIEYAAISKEPQNSHVIAGIAVNRLRNRFANIFPYDNNRVKLKEMLGAENTDYINASYVDGYEKPNAYIAAQGPLPNTLDDFWRMIWEYRLTTIVMLTQCFEGRKKCECYWPEHINSILELGQGIKIVLTSMTPFSDYTIRKMTVTNISEPDVAPIEIIQLHFLAWPDHGVPNNCAIMLNFVKRVRKLHPYSNPCPLLVHCSAGVGRTGTFFVLDSMLERMKTEDTLNVYDFVKQLRTQRVLMVQTLAQYIFIHDALKEVILCGQTEIPAADIRTIINQLNMQSDPCSASTGFEHQFQVLRQMLCETKDDCYSSATSDYNKDKNRYLNKLPNNFHRIHIKYTLSDTQGSDYINASFIDGYRQKKTYIATQGPLKSTVCDFWRMVWERESKCVVLLSKLTEQEEEMCFCYWPTTVGDVERYGQITVKLLSEDRYGDYNLRKFEINEDKPGVVGVKTAFTVTQFHFLVWPEHETPPITSSLIELVDNVNKVQMRSGNRPVIVMCNDGVGRTGTFICIHVQLERLKTEGVVDFFQFIKSARIHRDGLVSDVTQYVLCHDVVANYLDSFDTYANFKEVV